MFTLTNFAVALAGTALLGGVAAAPAPQVPTILAIVPITTATETYTDIHSSLTTATITISMFTSGLLENIIVSTSSAATSNEGPVPEPTHHYPTDHKQTNSV